ncbi:hypothetical protein J3R74_001335 [Puniceicoccus vermicola]
MRKLTLGQSDKGARAKQGRSPGGNIAATPGSLRIEDNGAPRITPCLPRPGPTSVRNSHNPTLCQNPPLPNEACEFQEG